MYNKIGSNLGFKKSNLNKCSNLWMKNGAVINHKFLTGQVMVGSHSAGL